MVAIFALNSLLDSIAGVALVTWLFRITVLATCACMYLSLARRAQPALRHAIAAGSLFAVVLLPVASKLVPAVNIPVLSAPVTTKPTAVMSDPTPVHFDVSSNRTSPTVVSGAIDGSATTAVASTARPEAVATKSLLSRAIALVRDAFFSTRNWIRFAVVMWALVAAALLMRLALAFARARRIAGRALLVSDEFLRVEVERASRVLGVTRWIDVAASDEIAVPMVIGVTKPRIVLPLAAQAWSRDRMSVVLLHEIAHIRRRDCVSMLFAQVVGALLWFHPLIAMLSRHVRTESERACDDLVLASGVRGSDYAEHLVSIAKLSARRDPLANSALAFAARSTLEARVASILSARPRVLRARVAGAVVAVAFTVFAVIAAVRPTPSGAVQEARHRNYTGYNYHYSMSTSQQERMEQKTESKYEKQARHEYQLAKNDSDKDKDNDNDGGDWYDRASEYYHSERWEKAAHAYENAAHFGYRTETAYYNAGCSYALAGQTTEAIAALQSALDEGFDDLDMYSTDDDLNSLRGDARFKKLMDNVMNSSEGAQRRRAATREFDRMTANKSADEGDWNSVGIDLMRCGEYDRAMTAFDNEYKLSNNMSENAIYNKACARALQGKNDEALKLLEQSISVGTVDADHMEEDADLYALHKDKRFDALVTLARDLELNQFTFGEEAKMDGATVVHYGIKHLGNDEEQWKKSVPRFQDVTKAHPAIGRAWFNLGFAQLRSGDAVSCTPNFQKALDLGFRPPLMMYNLACSTAQEGKVDAAFAWLDKSEKAGYEVRSSARWDDDLDPLRADPRWKELKHRWQDDDRKQADSRGTHVHYD